MPGIHPGFADKDFANYWTAGKLILAGRAADLFGPHATYFAHLTKAFGPDFPWHNWSYPPHYLLFLWPLGLFGYKTAMMLFLGVTGAFFIWAARAFGGRDNSLVWVAIIPFVAHNLWVAQNGFLFAGCALAALAFRDSRPLLAGVFLGLLTIKPQLGVFFPFLLLAERRWLVIASAAATTFVLVGLSAVVFGVDAWRGYFAEVIPYQTLVMRELQGTFLAMLTSIYGMLRNWGFSADTALALHVVIAIPAAVITIAAFFLGRSDRDRSVLLLVATFVVTPYALTYDLGLLTGALALLANSRFGQSNRTGLLIALAMLLPVIMMPLGEAHVTIAPLLIMIMFVMALANTGAWERLRGNQASYAGTGQGHAPQRQVDPAAAFEQR
ncbi:MAG: DUF2029 domain-containing protein [Mesorhizobium sp.]|nr:DUF2029 domain-containing protein [Mesorhizobium sp.]